MPHMVKPFQLEFEVSCSSPSCRQSAQNISDFPPPVHGQSDTRRKAPLLFNLAIIRVSFFSHEKTIGQACAELPV
jgi:hypothetical protein